MKRRKWKIKMNYEKLWNDFKCYLTKESEKMQKYGDYISLQPKDFLAHISEMEAKEYERSSAGCCRACEPDENADRKEPENKPDQNQEAERKMEPAEIVKKIFGNNCDYADSPRSLEKKMEGRTVGMIFVDPGVEFTKDIMNNARARGITIAHVSIQEINKRKSFYPFPPLPDMGWVYIGKTGN